MRRRVPRGGAAVGPAFDRGPAEQPPGQRARQAQRARGRVRRRRAAGDLRRRTAVARLHLRRQRRRREHRGAREPRRSRPRLQHRLPRQRHAQRARASAARADGRRHAARPRRAAARRGPSFPGGDRRRPRGPRLRAAGVSARGPQAHDQGVRARADGGAGMRYLITGGSGFVGSHLCDALTALGHRVTVLDDLSTGRLANIEHLVADGRVEFFEGSATDPLLVDDLVRGTDHVLHLASAVGVQLVVDNPLETLLSNVRGIDVVLGAAARHEKRALFTSTSEVYGKHSNGALDEEADLIIGSPSKSRWSYAIAKSFGDAVASGYHAQGAEVVTVRLFNAVGPRQSGRYGMVVPRFVQQALAGEDLSVHGDGEQTRCFTHVLDTVRALLMLSVHDGALGRTFNIGNGIQVSVRDLAERVIARTGADSQIQFVPYEEAYAPGFEELGIRRPDTSALRELTGWTPVLTLGHAIDDVIAHERGVIAPRLVEYAA